MKRNHRIGLAAALAALQVADIATTYWAINQGAVETNPVVNWLGLPLAAALKGAVAAGILVACVKHGEKGSFDKVLQFTVILYLAVIFLNLRAGYAAS